MPPWEDTMPVLRAQPNQDLSAQEQRDLNELLARRLFGRVTRRKQLATWTIQNPQDPDPRYGYDVETRDDDPSSPLTNRRIPWWRPVAHYGSDPGQAMAVIAELRRYGVGTEIVAFEDTYGVRMYEYLGQASSRSPLGIVASFTGHDLAPTIAQCAARALDALLIDASLDVTQQWIDEPAALDEVDDAARQ
jgi:hypothetical protein